MRLQNCTLVQIVYKYKIPTNAAALFLFLSFYQPIKQFYVLYKYYYYHYVLYSNSTVVSLYGYLSIISIENKQIELLMHDRCYNKQSLRPFH